MCKKLLITFIGVLLLTGSIPAFAQEVLYIENFEARVAEGWELERGWKVEREREVIRSLAGKGIVGHGSKKERIGPVIPCKHALN